MDQNFLTKTPLTYVDSIKFEHSGNLSRLLMLNEEQKIEVILDGVTNLTISSYDLSKGEDYLEIIDIQHEYRKVNYDDLQKFGLSSSPLISNTLMHIISIYGDITFRVICQIVEIKSICV